MLALVLLLAGVSLTISAPINDTKPLSFAYSQCFTKLEDAAVSQGLQFLKHSVQSSPSFTPEQKKECQKYLDEATYEKDLYAFSEVNVTQKVDVSQLTGKYCLSVHSGSCIAFTRTEIVELTSAVEVHIKAQTFYFAKDGNCAPGSFKADGNTGGLGTACGETAPEPPTTAAPPPP